MYTVSTPHCNGCRDRPVWVNKLLSDAGGDGGDKRGPITCRQRCRQKLLFSGSLPMPKAVKFCHYEDTSDEPPRKGDTCTNRRFPCHGIDIPRSPRSPHVVSTGCLHAVVGDRTRPTLAIERDRGIVASSTSGSGTDGGSELTATAGDQDGAPQLAIGVKFRRRQTIQTIQRENDANGPRITKIPPIKISGNVLPVPQNTVCIY